MFTDGFCFTFDIGFHRLRPLLTGSTIIMYDKIKQRNHKQLVRLKEEYAKDEIETSFYSQAAKNLTILLGELASFSELSDDNMDAYSKLFVAFICQQENTIKSHMGNSGNITQLKPITETLLVIKSLFGAAKKELAVGAADVASVNMVIDAVAPVLLQIPTEERDRVKAQIKQKAEANKKPRLSSTLGDSLVDNGDAVDDKVDVNLTGGDQEKSGCCGKCSIM